MTTILKNILLTSIVLGIMISVGTALNAIIPWENLQSFFSFLMFMVAPFDFFWDTETTLLLITFSLLYEIYNWGIRGLLILIHYSGWNN